MVATPILLDFLVYICNNIRKLRFDLVVRVLRAFFLQKTFVRWWQRVKPNEIPQFHGCKLNNGEIMSRQIQIRRGTAAEHENFTGAIGEITMDTTNKTLRVHDGETAGGTALAKRADVPSMTAIIASIMPDYANATDIPAIGTYTAETNLYLQGYVKLVWSAQVCISIMDSSDNILIEYKFQDDDYNSTRYMSFSIPVPAGCKYRVQHGGNGIIIGKVVPLVGG